MTVRDLIKLLETVQQDMPVAYSWFNGPCMMELGEINIMDLCDGRSDVPSTKCLVFPGN